MEKYNGSCNNCRYYFYDNSTGSSDCNNDDIDEMSLDVHFVNDEPGCLYYKAKILEDLEYPGLDDDISFEVSPYKLRRLCITNEWYTRGSAEDYSTLMSYCRNYGKDISVVDYLYTIAKDIKEHSREDAVGIESIMAEVHNSCMEMLIE